MKWRRLFRSDRLSDLTRADYESLDSHSIRLVYDLRRDSEAAAAPTNWGTAAGPALVRSPLFNDEAGPNTFQRIAANAAARHDPKLSREMMGEMYYRLVTEAGPLAVFRSIFERLADPEAYPVLFHCSGGKDRTGVTCALILSALGVSRRDVVEDFMLTRQFYDSAANLMARVSQIMGEAEAGLWSEAALVPIFGVEESYIAVALDHVDAAGGIESFLAGKVGLDADTLQQLRVNLLD